MATIQDIRNEIADIIRGKPKVRVESSEILADFVKKTNESMKTPPEKLVEMFKSISSRHG